MLRVWWWWPLNRGRTVCCNVHLKLIAITYLPPDQMPSLLNRQVCLKETGRETILDQFEV